MPLEWEFKQAIELKSQSRDVVQGVCMVMSYYVCKRLLAGLETTPDLLRRKMPLFASGQRAADGDVKLSSERWVEMLARRDNLEARVTPPKTDFDEAVESALGHVKVRPRPKVVGMCLNLYFKAGGHAVAVVNDVKNHQHTLFDPNIGLFSMETEADADFMEQRYESASKVGCVVLWGAPRDSKSLASD